MKPKPRYIWLTLTAALMMTLFFSASALAIGNLRLGLVEVNPKLALAGGFDDNVFLQEENEKEDEFGVVTPGINFTLEKEEYYINLGYMVDIIRYEDYSSQDTENHTGFGRLEFNFPGALFIKLENIYQDTSDYATSELDKRVDRRQNNGDASLGFVFSDDFSLELDYLSEYHKYDPRSDQPSSYEDLNRFEQEFGPAAYIRFLPKTSAILEYHYGVIDYFDAAGDLADNSSTFHQVMSGLQWEMTGKSTGTLKAGYQWKDYDKKYSSVGGKKVKKNDKDTWVVSGKVDVEFTPKTSTQLLLKREIVESTSTTTNNDYYVKNMASLGLTQKLLEKVFLKGGLGYYYNRYQRKTTDVGTGRQRRRRDKIFDAKIGLEYKIQDWLMVGADYRYRDRDSNFTTYAYTDNQGTAYVKVAF